MNNLIFGKAMESVTKQGHETCNNNKKKKLFGILTKLSYNKESLKKSDGNRNEKKKRNH